MFTLNCRGNILSLHNPVVMGIINATPDSFFEGHLNEKNDSMLNRAASMLKDGAGIIDIGGQSSRPGSPRISAEEEAVRVIPLIRLISRHFPEAVISADTYYSEVARAAVEAGAGMINDISAGEMDREMIKTVAALQVPYVCMHMRGTPETMQQDPVYTDVVKEVIEFFIYKVESCRKAGINDIIIDPGFGFGKTIEHNFQLLKELHAFTILGKPILAGLSRKSTIYKTLGIPVSDALNGTTVLNTIALMHDASILRVHDVKEAVQAIRLLDAYKKAAS